MAKPDLSVLKIVATGIPIPAVLACRFTDCFQNSRVFDFLGTIETSHLLSKTVPAVPAGTATIYSLMAVDLSYREIANAVLGEKLRDLNAIAILLMEDGKTFSPKQSEYLMTNVPQIYGALRLPGATCLSFVHDQESVSVLACSRGLDERLRVGILSVHAATRWGPGPLVLVRT